MVNAVPYVTSSGSVDIFARKTATKVSFKFLSIANFHALGDCDPCMEVVKFPCVCGKVTTDCYCSQTSKADK